MKITGTFWKSTESQFWLAEIPALDLMIQATSEAEIPDMVKDALSLLANCEQPFEGVIVEGNTLTIVAPDNILSALLSTRQQNSSDTVLEPVDIEDENLCMIKR